MAESHTIQGKMENENNANRKKEITIDDIKKCKGFEHLKDEEAKHVLDNLSDLARLIMNILRRQKII